MNIADAMSTIGLAAILSGFLYTGRKLQVLDELQKDIAIVKSNLKVVCDHLITTSEDFSAKELKPYSPLKLTKDGQKLIKDLGFDQAVSKHVDDFFQYIDSQEPKLKYDVESAAINSIIAFREKDYMSFIKVYLYNNPTRNISNLSPTLGVYIRDKYLKQHPEITE